MPKSEYFDSHETSNWNVAADYVKLKIMKPLYNADEYELIAEFGTSEMIQEYMVSDNIKNIARVKALKRLLKTLQMIINNTIFAIKKADVNILKGYQFFIFRQTL